MADKHIIIDNPTGLPMLPLDEIHVFQGDLKLPPTPTDMDKLKRSILDHHLFIAKAVFFEDGKKLAKSVEYELLDGQRATRDVKHPKTGEVIQIAAGKAVKFKAGKLLSGAVK